MKKKLEKFLLTLLILFSVFCFSSCVDKVVDDETALTAFLESYAKIMQKDGYVMEGNFDFNFCSFWSSFNPLLPSDLLSLA